MCKHYALHQFNSALLSLHTFISTIVFVPKPVVSTSLYTSTQKQAFITEQQAAILALAIMILPRQPLHSVRAEIRVSPHCCTYLAGAAGKALS